MYNTVPTGVTLRYQYPTKEAEWDIRAKVTSWACSEIFYALGKHAYAVQFIQSELWSGVAGFRVHIWDNEKRTQFNHFCTQLIYSYQL